MHSKEGKMGKRPGRRYNKMRNEKVRGIKMEKKSREMWGRPERGC